MVDILPTVPRHSPAGYWEALQERPMTRGAQATMADGPDVGVGHDACQEGYFGGILEFW